MRRLEIPFRQPAIPLNSDQSHPSYGTHSTYHMSRNRRTRLLSAMFLLINLLFMQWAVASYVCPAFASNTPDMAAMVDVPMPCAGTMSADVDSTQPNLCQAHCQTGQQSADKYELPALAAIFVSLVSYRLPDFSPMFSGPSRQSTQLERSTAPPLAIRHCCLRL